MTRSRGAITVRPVEAADRAAWEPLFAGYRDFYHRTPDQVVVDRVWGWLLDDAHELNGLVALLDGAVIGLAHHRRFARPSTGTDGLWLDDLFVDPSVRGHGAAQVLLEHLRTLACDGGFSVLRWQTAQDNDRARAVYDRVGTATQWVVYDATP